MSTQAGDFIDLLPADFKRHGTPQLATVVNVLFDGAQTLQAGGFKTHYAAIYAKPHDRVRFKKGMLK